MVLVMEAFQGYETRLQYDIVGHSGESDCIPFILSGQPPANNKERLDIIKVRMVYFKFLYLYFIIRNISKTFINETYLVL